MGLIPLLPLLPPLLVFLSQSFPLIVKPQPLMHLIGDLTLSLFVCQESPVYALFHALNPSLAFWEPS